MRPNSLSLVLDQSELRLINQWLQRKFTGSHRLYDSHIYLVTYELAKK